MYHHLKQKDETEREREPRKEIKPVLKQRDETDPVPASMVN